MWQIHVLLLAVAPLAAAPKLSGDKVVAEFHDRGLQSLRDTELRTTFHFPKDEFTLTLDGRTYDSVALPRPEVESDNRLVKFTYSAGSFTVEVLYELQAEWRFVSKQIVIKSASSGKFRIDAITVFRDSLTEAIRDSYRIERATGDYGIFCTSSARAGYWLPRGIPILRRSTRETISA